MGCFHLLCLLKAHLFSDILASPFIRLDWLWLVIGILAAGSTPTDLTVSTRTQAAVTVSPYDIAGGRLFDDVVVLGHQALA